MRTAGIALTRGRERSWSASVRAETGEKGEEGERGRVDNGSTLIEMDIKRNSASRTTTEDEAHSGTLFNPE